MNITFPPSSSAWEKEIAENLWIHYITIRILILLAVNTGRQEISHHVYLDFSIVISPPDRPIVKHLLDFMIFINIHVTEI